MRSSRVSRRARKHLGFALPAAVVAFALVGCAPQDWPDFSEPTPSPSGASPSPTSLEDALTPPVVTVRQFERILNQTRQTLSESGTTFNADLAATRATGPTLRALQANYTVRQADAALQVSQAVPDGEVELLLPQQSETWPRSIFAVVSWQDTTLAQSALTFVQSSPRENYRLAYNIRLEAGNTLSGPAADVGAPGLPPTTPLLSVPPADVATQYADVLLNGPNSPYEGVFQADGDQLRAELGYDYKQELPTRETYVNVNVSFANAQDDDLPVTLIGDSEGGAFVASSFTESLTLVPKEDGVTVTVGGAAGVLAGASETETGVRSHYQMQVLFYVPSANSEGDPVVLLGYDEALVGSEVLPE